MYEQYGNTALMYASESGHKDMAALLVTNAADMNIRNKVSHYRRMYVYVSVYMYVYLCMYVCMYVYLCMYV